MVVSVLQLEEAVASIIQLTNDVTRLSPQDSSKLYLAGLAFLYHLNADQTILRQQLMYVFPFSGNSVFFSFYTSYCKKFQLRLRLHRLNA
jgi:hypothetical protein